jgi:hypothetical protein
VTVTKGLEYQLKKRRMIIWNYRATWINCNKSKGTISLLMIITINSSMLISMKAIIIKITIWGLIMLGGIKGIHLNLSKAFLKRITLTLIIQTILLQATLHLINSFRNPKPTIVTTQMISDNYSIRTNKSNSSNRFNNLNNNR